MTAISADTKDFKLCRYAVTMKLVPFAGGQADTIQLSSGLSTLRIIKQYDTQVFPYYAADIAVSVDDAIKIQKAWRIGKVYITIERFEPASGTDTRRERSTGDYYIKDAPFQIMVCDGAPPNVPSNQSSNISRKTHSVLFHMELSPLTPLSINKKINNGAYHNLTITDFAATLASANAPAETPYKFYLAPSDNSKQYESVFIPPLNFVPAMRHIDKVYGMYAGKQIIFLDVDTGYILSSTKNTTGAKDPVGTTLEIFSAEKTSPNEIGLGSSYSKDTRQFRVRTTQRLSAAIDGPARRETHGESIKLVRSTFDERSGSNCRSCTPDNLQPVTGISKERVLWQSYDNALTADRVRVATRENYAPSKVNFSGCDLKAFNPNLQWTVLTNNEDMKPMEGFWRIRSTESVLRKAVGTTESCSVETLCEIVPSMSTSEATQK